MKHCLVCHKQYADDHNFCTADGTALVTIEVVNPVSSVAATTSAPSTTAPVTPVASTAPAAAPVQIIQMPSKSKTGLYIALGLIIAVVMVIGFVVWMQKQDQKARRVQEKQEQQAQAEYEQDAAKRLALAKLNEGDVKAALDDVSSGTSANFRSCADTKMALYQKRYNKWLESNENIPTKAKSQQNVNLAAQASISSCRKEAEALDTGAPSYDCSKVTTPSEIAICGNKELASLDVTLANASKSARFFATDTEQFNVFMKTWLKNRNSCGDNVDCISNTYKSTISTLNSQIEP